MENKKSRSWKNFLIDTEVQSKTVAEVVSIVFMTNLMTVGMSLFFYNYLKNKFFTQSFNDSMIDQYQQTIMIYFLLLLLMLLVVSSLGALFMVVRTHSFLGAKYAAVKYIREKLLTGQYSEPFQLREGSQFKDLELAINLLREDLSHRK